NAKPPISPPRSAVLRLTFRPISVEKCSILALRSSALPWATFLTSPLARQPAGASCRVQCGLEPVSDEVEAKDRQSDGAAGQRRNPPGGHHRFATHGHHTAPGDRF